MDQLSLLPGIELPAAPSTRPDRRFIPASKMPAAAAAAGRARARWSLSSLADLLLFNAAGPPHGHAPSLLLERSICNNIFRAVLDVGEVILMEGVYKA